MSIAIFLVSFVLGVPLRALAISLGWNWFIAPVFRLHDIGLIDAVGISLLINFLLPPTPRWVVQKEIEGKSVTEQAWMVAQMTLINPLLWIVLAGIWHTVSGQIAL